MLGRLLSGAGMAAIGTRMIRRGLDRRADARNSSASYSNARQARTSAIINKVRTKTRGIQGASNPRLFSKGTLVGQNRRNQASALIRGQRAGLPAGHSHSSYAAAQVAAGKARSRAIVRNVKSVTRRIGGSQIPLAQLSKKTPVGQFSRKQFASFIRQARKGPAKWGNFGPTYDFSRQHKHQGAKTP